MQFGKATDGAGTKTSPETVQRIIYGAYRNSDHSPLLAGGQVTGTSQLTYHVAAGSAVCKVAEGRAVYVVWDAADVSTTAPDTGQAQDTIYVDEDGTVGVARTGSVPRTWWVTLDARTITAGTTATTATTSVWQPNYAIHYGSTIGEITFYRDPATTGTVAADNWTQTLSFTLARDMDLELELNQSFATEVSDGGLGAASIYWYVRIDGGSERLLELPIDRRYTIHTHVFHFEGVQAGAHTIRVRRAKGWWGAGVRRVIHVGGTNGHGYTSYRVRESGHSQ